MSLELLTPWVRTVAGVRPVLKRCEPLGRATQRKGETEGTSTLKNRDSVFLLKPMRDLYLEDCMMIVYLTYL